VSQDIHDVVSIGTGAGGGTLAQRLASTGKRVLLLECGDFLPREAANWDVHEVIDNGRIERTRPSSIATSDRGGLEHLQRRPRCHERRVRRGVEVMDVRANIVVVACGAIHSAALCLRSYSDAHPRGLGNARDLVGRQYMCHNNRGLIAYSDELNTSRFQKVF
jgi:choline dehydrogenase-like flavoprotein